LSNFRRALLLGQAAACAAIADTLIPVLAIRKLDELAVTEVLYAFASVMPPVWPDIFSPHVARRVIKSFFSYIFSHRCFSVIPSCDVLGIICQALARQVLMRIRLWCRHAFRNLVFLATRHLMTWSAIARP
jgi:hypothetical protein